jgi:hypothetical protein
MLLKQKRLLIQMLQPEGTARATQPISLYGRARITTRPAGGAVFGADSRFRDNRSQADDQLGQYTSDSHLRYGTVQWICPKLILQETLCTGGSMR